MSHLKNPSYNGLNQPPVHRRNFLFTSVLGGLTLALGPALVPSRVSAAETGGPSVLPTPADSLSLYMVMLDRLKSNILNPYFDLLNCLSGEVTGRFTQLKKDVAELEMLVPELKSGPETSNLRSVTEVGFASASLMRTVALERMIFTNASFTLAGLDPEGLRSTMGEVQKRRGSLNLSPKAANLLRKILKEIHDLEKPSEGLGKTAGLITDLNDDLDGSGGKMSAIRLKLIAAMTSLIAGELSTTAKSPDEQNNAATKVQEAIEKLKELDSYTPPQSLQEYISKAPSSRCQEARQAPAVASVPTQSLRDLLEGTVTWIKRGGQISHRRGDGVQFIDASMSSSLTPDWFGPWYTVRGVLNEHLPPASNGRTFMCLSLITPILIGYDSTRRVNMINDQLVNLIPGGSSDRDAIRRKKAAERLAAL